MTGCRRSCRSEAFDAWLAGGDVPLGPYPAEGMGVHPVSTLVNKPANDDPRCIEPIADPRARADPPDRVQAP